MRKHCLSGNIFPLCEESLKINKPKVCPWTVELLFLQQGLCSCWEKRWKWSFQAPCLLLTLEGFYPDAHLLPANYICLTLHLKNTLTFMIRIFSHSLCLSEQSFYSNTQIKPHILSRKEVELCSFASHGFHHITVNKIRNNEKLRV